MFYHMRVGHGRSGRANFPAIVMGHGERDTLMLTVIIDDGDMVDESLVSEWGVGQEHHAWERIEPVRPLQERLQEPAAR